MLSLSNTPETVNGIPVLIHVGAKLGATLGVVVFFGDKQEAYTYFAQLEMQRLVR